LRRDPGARRTQKQKWGSRDMHHNNSQEASESEHTIYFQMSNSPGRFACAIRVKSSTREEAQLLFRHNSSTIEQMAREAIARCSDEKPQLSLAFP
jgi:hypothetical protein